MGWEQAALGPVLELRTAPPPPAPTFRAISLPPTHKASRPARGARSPSRGWVDAWWTSGAWVFVEDTSALFFLRYLWGKAGEMEKVSRDLPPLRTLPTVRIRQHESKMEGDLA